MQEAERTPCMRDAEAGKQPWDSQGQMRIIYSFSFLLRIETEYKSLAGGPGSIAVGLLHALVVDDGGSVVGVDASDHLLHL